MNKTDSIEQTVEKNTIRHDLVTLVEQYLHYKETRRNPIKTFNSLTLPAANWYYEKMLQTSIARAFFLGEKPLMFFHGVEVDKHVAVQSLRHLPRNCSITKCTLKEFLTNEHRTNNLGVGEITETLRSDSLNLNFAWADYCCVITPELIEDFAKMINNHIKEGIGAVTFCIKTRSKGGNKKIIRSLRKYCKSPNLSQAVKVSVNAVLRRYVRNKSVKCIYEVVYGGGKLGNTHMITLAYSVNIPAKAITPIKENRIEKKNEIRSGRYQASKKMEAMRGWKITCRRPKAEKTKEQIRVEMAVDRWEKKWHSLTKEKKQKIVDKYGVGLRAFACMVACRHGKFAEKRGLK